MEEVESENESKYKVVVGIDFGSYGCGYAYSFMNENKIYHSDIDGADVDKKVPTEIILDDKNQILQFGAKCKEYLKNKGLNAGHYFKGIKMHLYQQKTTIKSSNSNKELSLQIVIEKVLEKLKDLCLDQLNKSYKYIEESLIKWVVTVPAIWGDFEKGIMMEACQNIGLIGEEDDKSLFFALEPEAASLYCSKNDAIRKEFLETGKYYIICDLGGGTGDIVTHLVGSNSHLEEITPSCGGAYGSNEIDKKIFSQIIKELFGYENFNDLLLKYNELEIREDLNVIYDDWCNLERDIKSFKEGCTLEKVNNNEKYPISCVVFEDFFEEKGLNDLVVKYNDNLFDDNLKLSVRSEKKWIVEFPYKIIYNYIEEQSEAICYEIKKIHSDSKIDIDTIIFVGGYCSNEVLISKIKNNLGEKYFYMQPSNPCLAIMEGAVLFGLNPSAIDIRIAKYTIGMETQSEWNEELHSQNGTKIYDEVDEIWRCEECFYKFVEVNQKLKYNDSVEPGSFRMVEPRSALLKFYQTKKPNPIFTFEEGVDKIIERELDAKKDYPPEERGFKVEMKFGGTFFDVKAMHEKSGNFIKINLKYE